MRSVQGWVDGVGSSREGCKDSTDVAWAFQSVGWVEVGKSGGQMRGVDGGGEWASEKGFATPLASRYQFW